ncbi:MAG TPA: lysylphosphatidylglycerol synthase transmembrane domain-containing protein [Ignavibacteriaceae bacterium]|nr:lysylphosphatidylglycerol synthase transmembrane domain-containing protein [Ignavibacteriaceae bacterium]
MLQKLKKKIFISLAFAGLLYLGFTIYADYRNVAESFSRFNWFLFPLLLLLSMANYFFRFLKWDYYLTLLKIKVKKIDSFSIFMSGLIMSVTPGKMGELLKAYLVKQITNVPVSKTAPIIFAERITDFVSLILLALFGAYMFDYGRMIVLGVAIFFLLILIILSSKKIALSILASLEKINFLKKYLINIQNAYESSYIMMRPLPLFYMVLVSLVSWFFECYGFYLILQSFRIDVTLFWSAFAYAFATIVGAISMLPGGLGVTEGSLTVLLMKHASKNDAFASVFIVRVVTLWFAVLVGIISVLLYQKRFGKISEDYI